MKGKPTWRPRQKTEGKQLKAVGKASQRQLRGDGRWRQRKAQRRWGQRVNSIESQHRNLSYCVTLCGAIRSLKSEEGHWIFCLEDSLAVVQEPAM